MQIRRLSKHEFRALGHFIHSDELLHIYFYNSNRRFITISIMSIKEWLFEIVYAILEGESAKRRHPVVGVAAVAVVLSSTSSPHDVGLEKFKAEESVKL